MRLGLGPVDLQDADRRGLEAMAAQAVASSFDAIWVRESRADGAGGGLAVAAMLGQLVPIRVGAVIDAGLYHPLHMAEDLAVADLATQGRLEVVLRFPANTVSRYDSFSGPAWHGEFLSVMSAALDGVHMQWSGEHLRVPAQLTANQPVPERLAVNPRPAQPVVPVWVEAPDAGTEGVARGLGLGIAEHWRPAGVSIRPTGRWPGMVFCPVDVEPGDLLKAAGRNAAYFVVDARGAAAAAAAGRRLVGPLRMPGYPEWINSPA